MITASNELKDVFYNSTSVNTGLGCTIEYNMNSLIDNIAVTTTLQDSDYIAQIDAAAGSTPRINPFKKLFPVDAIVRPNRPIVSGIKYFILPPNGTDFDYPSPKNITHNPTYPRLYYPGVTTTYKYWITPIDDDVNLNIVYSNGSTKYAATNKIIVRFDKYHSMPINYTLTLTKSDNSTTVIGPYSPASSGECILYYNGTTWSNVAPTEPVSYPAPVLIKSIALSAVNSNSGDSIAVVEVSPRWIKDISSDIVNISIQKESSSRSDGLLPVGEVTSNSFSLSISKYDQTSLKTVAYNRASTAQFDNSIIYLVKSAELRPYIKVLHADGAITNGSEKYDKVIQGVFFIDTFKISEYGDADINCLDATKYLMETIAPEVLCEDYPVTAILRRLLDAIGFTNYNFNLHATTETSIPLVAYWWTDGTKTVWEAIQELCRDIQMNALVDEYNVLQFYSRDYLYSKTSADWDFCYTANESKLPNIITFDAQDIASANQVKVLWQVPVKSNYVGTSGALWDSATSFLSAGGLKYPIEASTTAANTVLIVELSTIDTYAQQQSLYNFQGYVMIDSEIIEFDALQYQYTPKNSTTPVAFWATSATDLNKYKYLSKTGYADPKKPETAFFRPTGRYRVKTRGALGTAAAAHAATAANPGAVWDQVKVEWV